MKKPKKPKKPALTRETVRAVLSNLNALYDLGFKDFKDGAGASPGKSLDDISHAMEALEKLLGRMDNGR